MTICINPTWNGNEPAYTFQTVEEAVEHISNNPSYEYLMEKRVRPYGDIDHYTPDTIGEFEFNVLNFTIYLALTDYFEKVERKVSLYTSSSFERKKISWRWVIPDVYVDSNKHAKLFAKTLYEQIEFPAEVKPDLGVYNSNQKMRMVGTSKPNENRPLVLDNCKLIDTIITYIPEDAEHIELELPKEKEHTPVVCDIPDETVKALLDCISVSSWQSYEICRNLIWAMCSSGVSSQSIHSYASKASNYGRKWVDDLIKSHNAAKSPNIFYIRKYAKIDNPTVYKTLAIKGDGNVDECIDELLALTVDADTIYDNGRYLMELPNVKTLAVRAHLGLGKTTRMKQIVRENPKARILILSGRRTFSDAIFADLKDENFIHYEHHKAEKGRKAIIESDRLIIQVSTASLKLIETQSYDIVFCDEIETLLTMLSPLSIYNSKVDYVSMYSTFERIIKETPRVIALDAFLCDRTLNMLNTLRGKTQILINTTLPYAKNCMEIKNENEFFRTLKKRIVNDNKRIVSVWGTAKAGNEFHKDLKHNKIETQFYERKSNEKIKSLHMSDVNTHWANYQSIGYTGVISVGINYCNKEAPFHQLSLYASAWGCGARDYAQALHRAREITDDEVLIHISPKTKPTSTDAGMKNQEDLWERENDLKRRCLEEMGESFDDYTKLPDWLKQVIMWNRNEVVINRTHLPQLMKRYLDLCGITVNNVRESEEKTVKGKNEYIALEDVPLICGEEVDYLNSHRKTMTEEDHYKLEKYFMLEKIVNADQFIWEQWLKNKSVVENAHLLVHSDANTLLDRDRTKVIELLPKNIPKLQLMQSLLFDWTKSWELPVEKIPVVDLSAFSLRKRTDKDTQEQYCRDLSKSIQLWCGYVVEVKRKRVKKNGECSYTYSMAYDFDKSIRKYIPDLNV